MKVYSITGTSTC